ncbi:MAG: DUF1929 domain-containing protein [Myxococcota bacterium]
MANLPDGRVLTFASNEPNAWPSSTNDEYTHAAVWDPETGTIRSVPHPSHDMFCAALVTIESGETFVMGGRNSSLSPWVSYYDFHRDRWVQFDVASDMNRGRWYPTAVYMGTGNIFIAAGIGGGPYPELWTPGAGWTLLSGIDLTDPILSYGNVDGAGVWPLMLLDPNGTIFHHGATPDMNRIDPFGGPGGLGSITGLGPHGFTSFPDEAVSVLYDAGKILVAGGSVARGSPGSTDLAYRIDLNGPAPIVSTTQPMNSPRQFQNEVVLPTGDVLIVGGSTTAIKFDDSHAVRDAELWDPDTGVWSLLNAQDQARTYHSTAVLLPDARVVSGGGGLNGDPCDGLGSPGECGVDHWNVEIFSPPYLFATDDTPAVRPEIFAAPGVTRVGRSIEVRATPGLDGFSLVRMSATTHTMNTDQRFLRPAMIEIESGVYELTLHPNENVLVPGYWMLFALDGEVPSVARVIQIVNDGTPRGPPIESFHHQVGEDVIESIELEDPDGNPISFFASGLPPGLTLSEATGVIQGRATTPGVYPVSILGLDGTESAGIEFHWVISAERSESGSLAPTTGGWNRVDLDHAYQTPVVILGPPSFVDPAPAIPRIRNVTSTSFEYRVEEWPYQDGQHGPEALAYLVVEAGEYQLAGGGTFVAGRTSGVDLDNPQTTSFTPGAFVQTPTVLVQIATTSATASPPTTAPRLSNVSIDGFTIRIQPQQSGSSSVPAETVHWLAIEPSNPPGLLESSVSPIPVDEAGVAVGYTAAFAASPLLFAALQTYGDEDPVALRVTSASEAAFTLVAQEEASADAETDHALEAFGWLAIEPSAQTLGLLPLFNEPPSLASLPDRQGVRGEAVSFYVAAVDPEGDPLSFSATGLPPGLAIGVTTGEIAGTLGGAGDFVVTVIATDPNGDRAMRAFLWLVGEPLSIDPFPSPPKSTGQITTYVATPNRSGVFEYVWEFGDGSAPSAPQTSPSISHLFPGPGRYVVTLTIRDPATLESATHQFVQAIVPPPTPVQPTASSSIAYEAASDRVWAVEPDNDVVAVIDASSHERIAEIPVGGGPETLALASDGRVWVACKRAARLQIIDPTTSSVVDEIPLQQGSDPHGLVFDPDGHHAFVALEGLGRILKFDGLSGALLESRDIGRHPRHLSVSADGLRLYATRFLTPPLPGEGIGAPLAQQAGVDVGGEVLRLDAETLETAAIVTLPAQLGVDSEISARGVPNFLGALVISPDGSEGSVPSKQDNVFRGALRDGLALTHDTTIRAISSRIDLSSDTAPTSDRLDYDNASVAGASVYVARGAYLLTTLEGNRQVAVVDALSRTELGRIETGRAPRGLALSPDGLTLFVDEFMDRRVSVFDLSPLVDYDDPALPRVATVSKTTSEALPGEVFTGKQTFYDAADPRLSLERYVYCAACHPDGGHDGRSWDFGDVGEGLRNTIDLRGHGVGQGFVHWTASFDEIQDFEGQIRRFGGTGLLSDADFQSTQDPLGPTKAGLSPDLDALAAYVTSLTPIGPSPLRATDGSLTVEAQRGRSVFEREACSACHLGSAFTDSVLGELHDVGTAKPTSGPHFAFDTPTLRGLWRNAPYLHDGSAATLGDAVEAHAGVSLSAADRSDLVAYLEQIDDAESTAPNQPPSVAITSPLEGASITAGLAVDLVASAADPEDGSLTESIVWSSDQDGPLGSGGSLSATTLTVGPHVVTATVVDRAGESGSDSIAFEIAVNAAPLVGVTLPVDGSEHWEQTPIVFAGGAIDPEEGDLSADLVWTSNLDGPIGSGAGFSRSDLSIGVHTISVSVVDGLGLPDSQIVGVTVLANSTPSVSIESPLDGSTALAGERIELSASAIDPEEGDIASLVAWSSDRDGVIGSGSPLEITTLSLGAHVLTASVIDGGGRSADDSIGVTIAPNEAPSVTLTAPIDGTTADYGTSVDLAATASDPEDGDLTASIVWQSSLDGWLGTGGSLSVASLSVGLHALTASVTDRIGVAREARVDLTIVQNAAPTVSITTPLDGTTATEGTAIALVATANDAEDGDLSASIDWTSSLDGPLGTGGSLSVATLSIGTHVVTALVVDSGGLPDSESIALTIEANQPPSIAIVSPSDEATATAGTSVDLIASANDPEDGDLTPSITWSSSLDGPLGSGGALSLSTLSLGTHVLTAAVTDALGLSGNDVRTLTIVANDPPTVGISAPLDGTSASQGLAIDLVASASDAEDGDLTPAIAWSSSLDGPLGSGGSLSVSTLSIGSHVLTAAVTDALGLSGSDARSLTIVANAAPNVSIAAPLDGATVVEGTSVDLIASADDAEDGDLTPSITWSSSLDGPLGSGGS